MGIDALLDRAAVGVCPTSIDAKFFPNKAFLYFSKGLPVLSAFQGELRKVLEKDGLGRYFDFDDAEALATFTGAYYSDELDVTYRFALHQGRLVRHGPKSRDQPLRPTAVRDRFQMRGNALQFSRDDDADVNGFTVTTGRVLDLRFRKVDPAVPGSR